MLKMVVVVMVRVLVMVLRLVQCGGCWCGSVPVPGGVWRGGQLQRRTSQPSVDSGQQTIAHRHTHTLVTS